MSLQVLHRNPGREGIAPLLAFGALGLAMVAFVAAGPWMVRTFNYAGFIPCVVASGA